MNMTKTQPEAKRRMQKAKRASRPSSPSAFHLSLSAFSLVELLVVIGILALLLGVLVPTISRVQLQARNSKSQANINLIEGGCEMYKTDFDEYPASTGMGSLTGAQMIVVYMTGYPDDPDDPDDGPDLDDLSADDGNDGFGFRTVRRGKIYGPYNGCENIDTDGTSPPSFIDAFDNLIYYFRWTGSNFDDAHNNNAVDQNYLNTAATKRRDFLLWSAGGNATINDPNNDADFDDITNFD